MSFSCWLELSSSSFFFRQPGETVGDERKENLHLAVLLRGLVSDVVVSVVDSGSARAVGCV